MIGISFWRVTRTAFQNFWRNIWLSIATTVIMTITLLMISFLYIANIFGGEVLRSIEQKVDLSITFRDNTEPGHISAIAQEIERREDVDRVTIISSEEALNLFRQRHRDNPLIEESLQELENNPLPASMYIVASDPRFYQNIAKHLEAEKFSPFVDEVHFESSKSVIERLISLISSVKNAAIILTAIFATLVLLIMFNTVRLAIYSFREEIEIMKLVGASRWFIQGPFVIEGVIVALIAVGLSSIILYPALNTTAPHLQRFFFDAQTEQFNLYGYAVSRWFTIIGLQLVAATGLAVVSSLVAVRRYLRY